MELENKVVTLEHALKMQMMENRVLSGYIANSKVYEAIVNRYILELKETLQRFDPGSGLLEFHIPTMPEKGQYTTDPEAERLCERDLTLSEIIDGIFQNRAMLIVGMPVLQNMDIELSNDS